MSTLPDDHDFIRERAVTDPVHGNVTLSSLAWAFVDTPAFQRLRNIKQQGVSYYVYV